MKAVEVIDNIASKTDECILFLSLGKDSLVLLDLIYPKFKRVVCVFMYFVKGLSHIQRYAGFVKARYPNIEFVEVPHWTLTYLFRGGVYCEPRKVKVMKLRDVVDSVKRKYGIEYVFLGMKKADSLNRRLMLKGYEPTYENKGLVYPLADWTQKEVLTYMRQHHLPAPVRYSLKAAGGVGFNEECFLWLRENCPQDLEKIYQVFPLSRIILFQHDNHT